MIFRTYEERGKLVIYEQKIVSYVRGYEYSAFDKLLNKLQGEMSVQC